MFSHQIVVGYHGCDAAVAARVVQGVEHLKVSTNDYDWLGHGIYFWEDSPARARKWAEEESRRPQGKIKVPAVVGAVINLGNCLNLVDSEALELVATAYQEYVTACRRSGVNEAVNKGKHFHLRNLDCAVFQTLHTLRRDSGFLPYDTIRGFFVEGCELYPGAGIRGQDHVQLCVRSTAQILGYFHPR
jgi:hypothetical protein